MEIWKPVEITKGFIEVSNTGRVRSLLRGTPYILKAQADKKGYLRVRMTIEREKMSIKVHREVAKAFIPNPNNLPQVNHKDGDKRNNRVENLEWCTNRQNQIHAIVMGLGNGRVKTCDSLSISDIDYPPEARKRNRASSYQDGYKSWNNPNPPKPVIGYKDGETKHFKSVKEAEDYVDSRHISDVLKGKRNHVKGWTFEYDTKGGDSNSYSYLTDAK